jgi:RNA polymerase sigma-70 factor, ECF subfamily
MLIPIPAIEGSGLASVATASAQGVTGEVSPERRREFDNLLPHALPRFRRMAMRWLRNPEDAEDAVQDAMLSAFRHIARFDGRAQMATWLTAIVINAIRMQVRRRPRGRMLSLDQSPEEGQWAVSEMLADSRPTPEQALAQRELHELASKLIDSLSPSQREALQIRQRDDFSIGMAAKTLGVPEGTVKARLARGRVELTRRFHCAVGALKTQASRPDSKTRRKASSSGYRPARAQAMASLPATVFNQQGGCGWVGA